jgi:O-antigen ligase
MRASLKSFAVRFNSGFILGLLVSLLSLVHLPSRIQVGAFDRNAAPQFIGLLVVGTISSILLLKRRVEISKFAAAVLAALILSSLISLMMSDSFITSLLGDTGRYSGIASLLAFLAILFLATSLHELEWRDALLGLSTGIVVVTLAGALQAIGAINLPTGGGVGSTLGNLDFLSAWIGTTLVLVILTFREFKAPLILPILYTVISIFVLWKIEAKQGYLDLILAAVLTLSYLIYRKSRVKRIPEKAWKALICFAVLLWSEIIYLVPVAKFPIPGVSNDPQVVIRADFWFSAAQMFIHKIGFGVGPDNYGNYYEKYRSLHSVKSTEFVLANDAHSSMLQTFATLGIFATLSFLFLILLVFLSVFDLYRATANRRYLVLLLSLFIFYTNALISPITLTHKAIFWMIGGLILGENCRRKMQANQNRPKNAFKWIAIVTTISLVYSLFLFVPAYLKFNSAISKNNSGSSVDYKVSNSLPCVVYAGAQLNLLAKSKQDLRSSALSILRNHPRCLEPLLYLAQDAIARKDFVAARPVVYQLLDVAPARQSVVRLAAIYAVGANDESLKSLLTSQGLKLGILSKTDLP